MDLQTREALLDEYEKHTRVVIAAEKWSPIYKKAGDAHAQLIKAEARIERLLKGHFRELADQAASLINWLEYYRVIRASYDVEVIVSDEAVGSADDTLFTILFEPVAMATAAGAQAGEKIYKLTLGLDAADTIIQRTALEHVADLVGKKVLEDGSVVTNEKAEYRISEATRALIRQSIQTSIALGEPQAEATKRLETNIKKFGTKRSELIAQTEAVNAYQRGMLTFGRQSGAIGKEWQDVAAIDICGTYSKAGPVPIDYVYDKRTGRTGPTAHPRCRCGLRLIYQNELDDDPELFSEHKK